MIVIDQASILSLSPLRILYGTPVKLVAGMNIDTLQSASPSKSTRILVSVSYRKAPTPMNRTMARDQMFREK